MQQRAHDKGLKVVHPKILITDTNRWPVGPRLAIAFSSMGCEVAVLCPKPGHPIEKTRSVRRIFRYNGAHPLKSLRSTIETFEPDLIIPLCDRGVQHLHDLHATSINEGVAGSKIAALIERSLGAPESFRTVSSRYELLKLARAEGIRVPGMIPVERSADLSVWDAETAPPWAVKADGTWGGRGVRVANNAVEAERHFFELTQHPGPVELAKRLLLNRDWGWILSERSHSKPGVIAQSYIDGRPANCGAACWQGELLAGICVEVIQAQGPKEPAIVVQVVDSPEMMRAAERIARRLNLSGFFGLDFVIEHRTGAVYLIEMNPRCTPPCPLPLGRGRDLVAALWAKVADQPRPDRPAATTKTKIAYFPQCWENSSEMSDAIHYDVPQGEPDLVKELLHPWSARSWLGQFVDRVRVMSDQQKNGPACVFEETAEPGKTDSAVDVVPSELRSN